MREYALCLNELLAIINHEYFELGFNIAKNTPVRMILRINGGSHVAHCMMPSVNDMMCEFEKTRELFCR